MYFVLVVVDSKVLGQFRYENACSAVMLECRAGRLGLTQERTRVLDKVDITNKIQDKHKLIVITLYQRCCLSLVDGILCCHGEAECRVHLLVEHTVTTGGAGLYGPPAFCNMGQ